MPYKFKPRKKVVRKVVRRKPRFPLPAYIKRVVNSQKETKYILEAVGATNIDNIGYLTQLCSIGQGDDASSRDGNYIFLKSFQFRFQITGADTTNYFRIMVVRALGNDLVLADLPSYYAFADHTKYYVHMDRIVKLQSNATPNTDYYKLVNTYIKMSRRLRYTGSGGSTLSNKIYLFLISDSALSSHPTAAWQIKTTFKDV